MSRLQRIFNQPYYWEISQDVLDTTCKGKTKEVTDNSRTKQRVYEGNLQTSRVLDVNKTEISAQKGDGGLRVGKK